MDGVLVDFVPGLCALHNRYNPYDFKPNHGEYSLEKLWCVTLEELWVPTHGLEFWENLSPTPEMEAIVEIAISAFGVENVSILSTPTIDSYCLVGKLNWIKKHLPMFARQYIFTPTKEVVAHPRALLIDDHDVNVLNFAKAGGTAILYPRPWNSGHVIEDSGVEVLRRLIPIHLETLDAFEREGKEDSKADEEVVLAGQS